MNIHQDTYRPSPRASTYPSWVARFPRRGAQIVVLKLDIPMRSRSQPSQSDTGFGFPTSQDIVLRFLRLAMISDKKSPPNDPSSSDAPPSYDTLGSSGSKGQEKTPLIGQAGPYTPETSLTLHQAPPFPLKSPLSLSSSSTKGKARVTNWLNFSESSESRTAREVRSTILCLVRDLIQEHISSSPEATGILQSCAEACSAYSLSLSSILQEKSIVNHTPLYWAIVKRLPDQHQEVEETSEPDLLSALISHASPLNANTIADLRLACLGISDQPLFQRLRLSPEFSPISVSDQMLFGMTVLPDDITVMDLPGEAGAFEVDFVIPHFHKRMVVSKEITLEFIARSK